MGKIINVIRNETKKAGFLDIGVVDTGFSYNSAKRLLKSKKDRGKAPFVSRDIIIRSTPKKYVCWAKSIIIGTYSFEMMPGIIDKPKDGYLRGRISRTAWGRDYHVVLRDRLNHVGEILLKNNLIGRYQSFVDTSPLAERELAFRAKIGTFGKNNAIISSNYGSLVFIGGLMIDVNLPVGPIDPAKGGPMKKCLECNRCILNCPGNALEDGNRLSHKKCVSYLTVKKGVIDEDMRSLIGDNIYGCDRCLEVCPVNYNDKRSYDKELDGIDYPGIFLEDIFPRLDFLICLTKKEFNKYYANTALSWRGKTLIQRNAVIVLGNLKDPTGIELLMMALKNKGEIVSLHALWSIGRLYNLLSKSKKESVKKELVGLREKRKDIWTKDMELEYNKLMKVIL